MAEDTTVTTPNTGGEPGQTSAGVDAGNTTGGATAGATFTQDDLNRILKEERVKWQKRLDETAAKERAEAERKNAEAQALAKGDYEAAKALLEKQLAEIKAERDAERKAALISRVALKHSLPPELADRLKGDTEEELDADAARLAKLIVPSAPNTETGRAGAQKPAPLTQEDIIRRKRESGLYAGI